MRKKTQIGIVLAALVLLFAIILWVHQSRQQIHDLPVILNSGRLSVLTDSSTIGFSVNGDSVSGFQYEIVKAFADTLGLELVVTEQNDLKLCVNGLKSGDYDIIASLMPITTEWKNEVLFTTPLFTTRQVLVQRLSEDSAKTKLITNQLQLSNDTIYIPANSPYKMQLNHLSDQIANPIQILELKDRSAEQMVQLVASGKIKYSICSEQLAHRLLLKYPNIDVSLPIGFSQQLAWGVNSKSPQLLEKLNVFLSDFIGSSAYWDIYRKYQ